MNPQSVRPLKRDVRYVQPNKPLLQSPQTLCRLLPCCYATAASIDMRRSRIARR